jgi:DNA polymerase I
MNRLVLVDGNAILYRAYHAMPDLTNYKGDHIGALHGMVSMLLKAIQDLRPTHIIFCFDEKGENFRHKLLKTYQENRTAPDESLIPQLENAPDLVRALGIPVYSHNGYEADDLIGTIANKVVSSQKLVVSKKNQTTNYKLPTTDYEVIIVTGDRDLLQLVDDKHHIKLLMPLKGLVEGQMYDEAGAKERMGVPPSQVVDLKGLTGDASDNYKGVPGIGPKTAQKLLDEFDGFIDIYKNLDKIPEKIRKKLETGRESGELSYKLAQIVKDVDIDIDFEAAKDWDLISPKALKKYEEVGFKSLTERIKKVFQEMEDERQGKLW